MEQEQLRKEAERRAIEYVSRYLLEPYNKGRIIDGYTKGFLAGAEWEAEREKWIEFDKMSKEEKWRLNYHPHSLIICQFDNGDILRYDEEFPFAELTHLLFIPSPPKTSKQ